MQETQHVGERTAPKDGAKSLGAVSPLNGARLPTTGRPKGTPNKVTQTIRDAIEQATRDVTDSQGRKGLVAWLLERANGGIQDRQIFAGMVQKALPLQVAHNVNGGITIAMPWLAQRGVASVAQIQGQHAQVLDITDVQAIEHRINDASDQAEPGLEAGAGQARATPHPPSSRGRGAPQAGAPPPAPSISKMPL